MKTQANRTQRPGSASHTRERCSPCGLLVTKELLREFSDPLLLGIGNVRLHDSVEKVRCAGCGTYTINVPQFDVLVQVTAALRANSPPRLRGADIRLLRLAMRLTAKELAGLLGTRAESISRWENDRERASPAHDRLLRILLIRFVTVLDTDNEILGEEFDEFRLMTSLSRPTATEQAVSIDLGLVPKTSDRTAVTWGRWSPPVEKANRRSGGRAA